VPRSVDSACGRTCRFFFFFEPREGSGQGRKEKAHDDRNGELRWRGNRKTRMGRVLRRALKEWGGC